MDKTKQEVLQDIARLLRYLGDLFDALVDEEPAVFNAEEIGSVVSDNEDAKAETGLTLEQVRSVLGKKSDNGFTKEVHELLKKFGAEKLSDLDAKHYEEILAKAEDLKHA